MIRKKVSSLQKTTPDQDFGLGNDWNSVQQILEEIIPVYERTNRFISLGSDLKLRRKGLELLRHSLGDSPRILDLGCGTGSMSRLFLEHEESIKKGGSNILLADPISKMMRVAISKTKREGLLATFETLPIRQGTFDAAMAGFSLRDAQSLSKAMEEIHRLLKPDGKFLVVDLSKPDSKLRSLLISWYWRAIAPIIAFVASGRVGLKFGALWKTYKRLPKNSEMLALMQNAGFRVSNADFSMLGGACVILLTKVP